eukprot:TRINITY_DN987_c0_g1_i5.p1 TRINITY_DN987_c0_g1~~TRINITY_DN987_c0_g1_i5.p1  ORF type:complete len:2096 (+),score=442.58 TRINITY_DN987_c0_g1_i5:292-6288(+)
MGPQFKVVIVVCGRCPCPDASVAKVINIITHQFGLESECAICDVGTNPEQEMWACNVCYKAEPVYPRVFVGDQHVGSTKEFEECSRSGALQKLLARARSCSIQLGAASRLPPPSSPFFDLGFVTHYQSVTDWKQAHHIAVAGPQHSASSASPQPSDLRGSKQLQPYLYGGEGSAMSPLTSPYSLPRCEDEVPLPAEVDPPLDQRTKDELSSLLFVSCSQGRVDWVDRVAPLCDINAPSPQRDGATPLQVACAKGRADVVRRLFALGADVTTASSSLHAACASGSAEVAAALLEAGADPCARGDAGQTPLHVAASRDFPVLVDRFLHAGCSVDAQDSFGRTALHLAVAADAVNAVELLLFAGASLVIGDAAGLAPLHVAVHCGRTRVVARLLKAGSNPDPRNNAQLTPLMLACQSGNLEATDMLLQAKANPSLHDSEGMTPLHWACKSGHLAVVDRLLQAGCPVDATEATGKTPLRIAVRNRHLPVVERLLRARADVNIADEFGATCLYVACAAGHLDMAKILVRAGADVEKKDKTGRTPLFVACAHGLANVSEVLLAAGACPGVFDASDTTSLHVVAQEGYAAIAQQLLRAGAQVDAKDAEGWTPLLWACQSGQAEVVDVLLAAGADVLNGGDVQEAVRLAVALKDVRVAERVLSAVVHHPQLVSQGGLRMLDLSHCRLRYLPPAVASLRCDLLDIQNNELDSIPVELATSTTVREVAFRGNPLSLVPKQYQSSWPKMRDFFRSYAERSVQWRESFKVVFTGPAGGGKSSLVRCLQRQKALGGVGGESGSSAGRRYAPDTAMAVNHFTDARTGQRFDAWEVPGTEPYYAVPQTFCFSDSVYVVVFNLMEYTEQAASIKYWLSLHAATLLPGAGSQRLPTVFVVGTHLEEAATRPNLLSDITTIISKKYPRLGGLYFVGCRDRLNVADLRAAIAKAATTHLRDTRTGMVPANWVLVRDALRARPEKVLDYNTIASLMASCNVPPTDAELLFTFLQRTDALIRLRDADNHLMELFVLDVPWLAHLVGKLFAFAPLQALPPLLPRLYSHKGFLLPQWVASVAGGASTDDIEVANAISCLNRFDALASVFIGGTELYLVPDLLTQKCPQPEELAQYWPPKPVALVATQELLEHRRVYIFGFVPSGLFCRLLVRVHRIAGVRVKLVWRNGVVATLGKEVALVVFDPGVHRLTLAVRFERRDVVGGTKLIQRSHKHLLRLLTGTVDCLITACYPGLRASMTQLIPCTHCLIARQQQQQQEQQEVRQSHPLLDEDGCTLFLLSDCQQAAATGQLLLHCPRAGSECTVRVDLLAPDTVPLLSRQLTIAEQELSTHRTVQLASSADSITVGTYRGQQVLIKEAPLVNEHPDLLREFLSYAAAVRCASHKNVARLLGVVASPLRLVTEALPSCVPLRQFLAARSPAEAMATATDLSIRIALDIACGLEYLTSIVPAILQRDFSSNKVAVVDVNPRASICAKVCGWDNCRFTGLPPGDCGWRWRAPEVSDPLSTTYAVASDVYSFGIVLWELVAPPPALPFAEFASNPKYASQSEDAFRQAIRQAVTASNLRPTVPASCPAVLAPLISLCLVSAPLSRPRFPYITAKLAATQLPLPPPGPQPSQPPLLRFLESRQVPAGGRSSTIAQVTRLLSVGADVWCGLGSGSMLVLDAASFAVRARLAPPDDVSPSPISGIALAGEVVWVSSVCGNIALWHKDTFEAGRTLRSPVGGVSCMASSSSERFAHTFVWCGTTSGAIVIWNATTYSVETMVTLPVPPASLTLHGSTIVVTSFNKVFLFNASTFAGIQAFTCNAVVTAAVCCPRGYIPPCASPASASVAAAPGSGLARSSLCARATIPVGTCDLWTATEAGVICRWQLPPPSECGTKPPCAVFEFSSQQRAPFFMACPHPNQLWIACKDAISIWEITSTQHPLLEGDDAASLPLLRVVEWPLELPERGLVCVSPVGRLAIWGANDRGNMFAWRLPPSQQVLLPQGSLVSTFCPFLVCVNL